jgi:hypothetical protein
MIRNWWQPSDNSQMDNQVSFSLQWARMIELIVCWWSRPWLAVSYQHRGDQPLSSSVGRADTAGQKSLKGLIFLIMSKSI